MVLVSLGNGKEKKGDCSASQRREHISPNCSGHLKAREPSTYRGGLQKRRIIWGGGGEHDERGGGTSFFFESMALGEYRLLELREYRDKPSGPGRVGRQGKGGLGA